MKSNQSGYITIIAAVSVGVICSFLVVGTQAYLQFKSKTTGRIREALEIQAVMEAAAKVVSAVRNSSPSPNPALFVWPPQNNDCLADCTQIFGGQVPRLCYNNPSAPGTPAGPANVPPRVPGRPYCFFETAGTTFRNSAQLHFQLRSLDPIWDETMMDRLVAATAWDKAFDSLMQDASGIFPRAQANIQQSVDNANTRADVAGVAPLNCAPGNVVGCQSCGGPSMGTVDPVMCVNLELCPATFPNCTGAGAPPLFRQTVMLIPPGYQR